MYHSIIVLLLLTACSYNPNPKVAALSKPTAIINTTDTKKVANKIAELCDRETFQVESITENTVLCSREAPIMAQAFLGTRYGTNVRSNLRFSIFSTGKTTKAVGNAWFGNQNAFGQNRTYELENGESKELLSRILNDAKIELEVRK